MDKRLKSEGISFATVDARDEVYFVARNPYTRLLSLRGGRAVPASR